MLTIGKTSRFVRMAETYRDDAAHPDFIGFIAASPDVDAVIPGSSSLRKIR